MKRLLSSVLMTSCLWSLAYLSNSTPSQVTTQSPILSDIESVASIPAKLQRIKGLPW
jgi:hypothetical protein